MAAIIGSAMAIVLLLLQAWRDNQPQRMITQRQDDIQQGRRDIDEKNVDAIAARIDRIRRMRDAKINYDLPVGRQPTTPGDQGATVTH